jgi:bacteriorhodopsin
VRGEEAVRTLSGLLARPAKLFFGLPVVAAAVLPLIIHRTPIAARFRVTVRLFFGRSAALLSNVALLPLADGAELRRIGLVGTSALAALLARFLPALLTLPVLLLLSALFADLFTRTVLGSVVAIILLILFHIVTP